MKLLIPNALARVFLCAAISLLSLFSASAADNFPYGCIVFYDGAERVFTDFQGIDPVGGARTYSLATSYKQGTGNCEVRVEFSTPYSGGCSVTGVTNGSNVTIAEVYNCSIDHGTAFFMVLLGLTGVVAIRKTDKK
ncbi:hypothetical protein ACTJKC_23785 [Pedobacter sp. 22226]|uniref:hypothetical protein n=1 Tax=Pedobacter sp. 22226 TaxID=3453894 RepID=UPI003F843690